MMFDFIYIGLLLVLVLYPIACVVAYAAIVYESWQARRRSIARWRAEHDDDKA